MGNEFQVAVEQNVRAILMNWERGRGLPESCAHNQLRGIKQAMILTINLSFM